ncbi:ATP-binding cassette domain-containing protein [Leifsonia sp. TF02-11]|uniref:ATP-binding cassette domain-containing protein n=1 Tax=Leifsonia sp. TF02-11 TaxID=2815212 RepID=UPI001AA1CD29|nr:ATP-binding cassette domain-containing protein [Leifsonia sp. TF02-11]MBO1737240.1 ATP-binding cassette domain-containing protein [Leifsonia sp. TF02-11]
MPKVGSGHDRRVVATELSHRFGEAPILFGGLSFTLVPNEVYALTGPSGSGKSTLLSVLAGWLEPASGSLSRVNIGKISWIFQNPHGVAARTAEDHVALPLLAQGRAHEDARAEARVRLAHVGLSQVAGSPFRELSGGEAQRLMLARGLASEPDLLLVDEPTAQLDPRTAAAVNEAIASVAGQGCIVVVATHDPRTRAACTGVIDLAGQ